MHICELFRNFAANLRNTMKRIAFLILLCTAIAYAHAETLILRTGARVKGSIVFQNEEVVILRTEEGARFQYPRADIEQILSDEEAALAEETASPEETETSIEEIKTPKKASILLEIAGGYAVVPSEKIGAQGGIDLLVGSHHIADRHIFIGGGIGYHGLYLVTPVTLTAENVINQYNFLPVQAAVRVPLTEKKHAPVFGLSLGYGVALSKNYLGGIYTGLDFGYRCQINPKTALGAVLYAQFQQATIQTSKILDGNEFTGKTTRNIVTFGAKFTVYF